MAGFLGDSMVKKWAVDFDVIWPWLYLVVENASFFLSNLNYRQFSCLCFLKWRGKIGCLLLLDTLLQLQSRKKN